MDDTKREEHISRISGLLEKLSLEDAMSIIDRLKNRLQTDYTLQYAKEVRE